MFNIGKKTKEEPENLEELLFSFKELKKDFEKISKELKALKKEHKFSVQKVGIVRFNPFSEVGGDQSFSIAFLDGNNDGVVITSHYARESSRVYGKDIKNGSSEYILSQEEIKAIESAKNYEQRNKQNSATNSGGPGSY